MDEQQNKGKNNQEQVKLFLNQWRASGKTQLAFSKEQGINYYTFNKWVNDAKGKVKKPSASGSGFTQLSVSDAASSGLFAEIKKDGITVVLHQTVSADFLRILIK